jgi:periodic tryptophan protein 1
MITATTWVPRGFAAPFPNKYVFNEEEYERIAKLAELQIEDAKEDLEEAQKAENEVAEKSTKGSKLKASKKDSKAQEYVISQLFSQFF